MELRCRDSNVSLDRTVILGVLNVTPDSFSDGGLWFDTSAAVKHGLEMQRQGAAIIDVGGESTRPGADAVDEAEELRRVLPVIESLAAEGVGPISIDTRKPAVAEAALEAGAAIINDTTGEETDPAMGRIAATTGAGFIVMHSRGSPATMRSLTVYSDVVGDVRDFLVARAEQLQNGGVARESIVIDPGIGFAKDAGQSVLLTTRVKDFVDTGYPVLLGTSRKSFIGKTLDLGESDRVEATVATAVWGVTQGVRLLRVHDVEPHVRAIRMVEAILSAG
ncbi:MAG: dihydropteroate synthase [Actinomycetota bacterium]|nr:dihydropteroate synthase [Actinomycetota bacterium]